jgi:hypothetical protein
MAKKAVASKRTESPAPIAKSKTSSPKASKRKFNDDDLDLIQQALHNEGVKEQLIHRVMAVLKHPGATEAPEANRRP